MGFFGWLVDWFFYKEEIDEVVETGGDTSHEMMDFWIVRDNNKRKQDDSPGLQNKLWPNQRPTSKNPMSYSLREERGQGELVDFQGSSPPSSEMIHPYIQEVTGSWMNRKLKKTPTSDIKRKHTKGGNQNR